MAKPEVAADKWIW